MSAFQVQKTPYSWEVADYQIEDQNDLVIYELHFRDFSTTGDIKGAMQQLDYIEGLGVNAIELMPIHEFSGSDSWGYNPIAYFALEKSYGTREMYKQFIDECHKRGMAVIVDVVYNHAHEDHPMAGLYFNWNTYKPTSNNPWFNVDAPHPYGVFHDFNHENAQVREYVKESLSYLINEYKVDGFRFDLTKGFTQKNSGDNDAVASAYDQSRVDILSDYTAHVKSVDPNAVVILEHFADSENSALAKAGAKVWKKCNYEYRNAMLGGSDNFGAIWTGNGDLFGAYVGYMESHDEERICYGATSENVSEITWGIVGTFNNWTNDVVMKADAPFFVAENVTLTATDMFKIRGNKEWNDAYNYGASSKGYKLPKNSGYTLTLGASSQDMAVPAAGTYDIYFSPDAAKVWLMETGKRPSDSEVPAVDNEAPLARSMRRAGSCAAFSLLVPGPKMVWQFGEIGYDVTIEENGRTGRKPVKTAEYVAMPERKALYDTYAGLIAFRMANPRFFDKDATFNWTPSGTTKVIKCTADGKSFYVIGNFSRGTQTVTATPPSSGTWTNLFDKTESFTGSSKSMTLKGGEFKLFVNW